MTNKFSTACVDCGRNVPVGQGLSEKKSTLGMAGPGWLTRHRACSFKPTRPPPTLSQYRPHRPGIVTAFGGTYDDEYGDPTGMTESEFFGGDIGDKG